MDLALSFSGTCVFGNGINEGLSLNLESSSLTVLGGRVSAGFMNLAVCVLDLKVLLTAWHAGGGCSLDLPMLTGTWPL